MGELPLLPSRATRWAIIALFAIVALLVYGASLGNGFVRWDDGLLIYQNPAVMEMTLASFKRAFTTYDPELYIPITLLSYKLDYFLGQGTPFLFHFQSLALHVLNALLVCWLAFLLIKHRFIALILGLLFLVHPLNTEAVSWASGRKDVLSTFFFLSSIITFFYSREPASRRLYLLSLMLFILGLMSKVMIVTLPVIILLIIWHEHGRLERRDFKRIIPYALLCIVFGLVALYGKIGVNEASTVSEKVLMAFKSSIFYLGKFFWPVHLSVIYPYTDTIVLSSPDFFLPFLGCIGLAIVALVSMRFTRTLMFAFLFYFITLAPTFINIAKGGGDYYIGSDRYAYIPVIGVLLLIGFALTHWIASDESLRRQIQRVKVSAFVATVIALVLAGMASAQSLVWASSQTLFEHVIAVQPEGSFAAYNNLGNVYRLQRQYEKAAEYFQKSLALKEHPRTYVNFAALRTTQGNYEEALHLYDHALEANKEFALAYFGKGNVYAAMRDDDKAFIAYDYALGFDPNSAEVYTNIGVLRVKRGEMELALQAYEKAIAVEPLFPDAHYNKAVLFTKLKRYNDAIEAYEKAIDLRPYVAASRINLGLLYLQENNRDGAVKQFQAILRFDPANKAAHSALEQLGAK